MAPEISEQAIRAMQQKLREPGRQSSQYIAATAAATVRPMLEVAWPPMLACFSLPMEDSDDPQTVAM
jgi:Sec7-like guanine-nucleotide exchange factor